MNISRARLLGLVCAAVIVSGCGEREKQDQLKAQNDIRAVGIMYHKYQKDQGKPPARLEDLKAYENDEVLADGYKALKDGRITVIWNAPTGDQPGGAGAVILAYFAKADADGKRMVITADALAKTMTEQEFQAAPKARPK